MEPTSDTSAAGAGSAAAARKSPRRRAGEFFVAGGPVAPERRCYLRRAADRQLLERLLSGDYCHVIAPRFSGKSSLAASTARRVREADGLAAVVDLSQLGSRDGSAEAGRWYYSLAYRVLRDLRLKLDLQAWWQEHLPLSPAQRLGEFFWTVVVGGTKGPVVILLDEMESVEQAEHAAELFKVIRGCFDARAAEPEYARLSFALLGTALPAGAAERASEAVTEISTRIELHDFTFEQARPLAEGLGLAPGDAERALYRVLYWTGGHPYLTQRLCQAIARNATHMDSDDAVDALVRSRFLGRNVVRTEASMSRVLDSLDRAGKLARPALRLYRRIHRGRRVRHEPDNPKHQLLRVCGLATVTGERRLAVRNRIYAEAFSRGWAREALPVEWGRLGRIAVVLALVVGGVWVYAEVLPRPYEQTLRVASVEMEEAQEAWSGLRRIPGFGAKADRLLARVLARHSRRADNWAVAAAADERMRALPGYEARADGLLVEFWERRAAAAEAAERRDAALLYRMRAYQAGPTADAGRAAALAGGDYAQLQGVIRTAAPVELLAADPSGRSLVTLSGGNLVQRWDGRTGVALGGAGLELLADEFLPVRRRLGFDAPGRVTAVRLDLRLEHEDPARLHARLVAPSGRVVVLPLALARSADGSLVIDERQAPGLRVLRGEQALGTWTLELEQRRGGTPGMLLGWSLRLSDATGMAAQDEPENPPLLEAPTQSSVLVAALSPDGALAAAAPRNATAGGRLHFVDLASGARLASIELDAAQRQLGFADSRTLLLLERDASGDRIRVLDATDGSERFSHVAASSLVAGPAVSPDGLFLAALEGESRSAWVRSMETGRVLREQPLAGDATALAVSPGGLQLAAADRDGFVRVWHVTDGALAVELRPGGPVTRLEFGPAGRWLAATEASGRLLAWDLGDPAAPLRLVRPNSAGMAGMAGFAGGGQLINLDAGRGYELWDLAAGSAPSPVLRDSGMRVARAAAPLPLQRSAALLLPDGRFVGGGGSRVVRTWRPHAAADPMNLPRIPAVVALGPAGLRAASGTADGRVALRLRDPESLRLQLAGISDAETRHGEGVAALAFSPGGARLASAGGDGSIVLWNTADGSAAGPVFQHGGGRLAALALSPDERTVVVAGERGARVWNGLEGRPGPMLGAGREVTAVALDGYGARAFTGTPEGLVESWDVRGGERLWFSSLDAPVDSIALSTDGMAVAAGSETGLVRAWGMGPAGRAVSLALAAPVLHLAFSPDGEVLLAQTPSWLHRLGLEEGRLQVLSSRMLPASVPPSGWRTADAAGTRVALVGGARGETMAVLDFDRAEPPPEDWSVDLQAWQARLQLYFDAEGELRHDPAGE
jgi:WD40 repeat protein